jgi:hypothetical protein
METKWRMNVTVERGLPGKVGRDCAAGLNSIGLSPALVFDGAAEDDGCGRMVMVSASADMT